MKKIVVTLVAVLEYTPKPENYPPGSSLDTMMAIDLDSIHQNPWNLFIEFGATQSVTAQIIEEPEKSDAPFEAV